MARYPTLNWFNLLLEKLFSILWEVAYLDCKAFSFYIDFTGIIF